jgi:multiple antibiotic resistance protein
MSDGISFLITVWVKFFFLFTPFFALSMFLSMTKDYDEAHRRRLALQTSAAVGILCFGLFFFGSTVFSLLGITLDAFRVGAGALLFLSAVALVQAKPNLQGPSREGDIAVVPLAIPIIVGPATIGTLLVLGAEITTAAHKALGCLALVLAVASVGMVLWLAASFERALGKKGIDILSKVTGVVLSALAAQMILTGVRHFLTTVPE